MDIHLSSVMAFESSVVPMTKELQYVLKFTKPYIDLNDFSRRISSIESCRIIVEGLGLQDKKFIRMQIKQHIDYNTVIESWSQWFRKRHAARTIIRFIVNRFGSVSALHHHMWRPKGPQIERYIDVTQCCTKI